MDGKSMTTLLAEPLVYLSRIIEHKCIVCLGIKFQKLTWSSRRKTCIYKIKETKKLSFFKVSLKQFSQLLFLNIVLGVVEQCDITYILSYESR